jgi:hypothetical protein
MYDLAGREASMGRDIDEYRSGYEAGKDASVLLAPLEAADYLSASEDWQKGYEDATSGKPFDPSDD